MADLNDTFTDFGIQQGAKYLGYNRNKVATIDGGRIAQHSGDPQPEIARFGTCGPVGQASSLEGFTGDLARFGKCNLNVTSTIEGFTGAFGSSAANSRNDQQAQHIAQIRSGFDAARSQYATAQKTLMSETAMFVNNSSDKGPGSQYRDKFVKLKDGNMGYVTDRNIFMPVTPAVYNANKGKNGCNPAIVEMGFSADSDAPQGLLRKADAVPNFFIGKPMTEGQSCASTNVNLQVMGATDPSINEQAWLGCRQGINPSDYATEQKDISSLQQTGVQALERCRIRAADKGAAVFAIGPSSYGGSYGCYVGNPGVTGEDIVSKSQLGTVQQVSSVLQKVDGSGKMAGLFYNGQVGMSDPSGDLRNVNNLQLWNKSKPFDNCDAQTGATINVVAATYGANCNGQTNPVAAAASQAEANAQAFKSYQVQQAKQAAAQKAVSIAKAVV